MSNNVQPLRSNYVTPSFNDNDEAPNGGALDPRVRGPIRTGAKVIAVAVFGLGLWASLTPISSGVQAPGFVRVESNRKTLRHKEGGTVRAIYVKEGSHVSPGQVLLKFDDVQSRAPPTTWRRTPPMWRCPRLRDSRPRRRAVPP
jgi:hypothetical protein